ncbi:MAG: hypothetical protein JXQ73_13225 [Phycisphaerae bacterium]|nr:hypothetical protein [Phycisphaerae bacterium]
MSRARRVGLSLIVAALLAAPTPLLALNGEILDQQLSGGKGYTVLRVWGGHYDMGYAFGWLMHAETANLVGIVRTTFNSAAPGGYNLARDFVSTGTTWAPAEIEQEMDGIVAALAVLEPAAAIDKIDLKVINSLGDLGYLSIGCRAHSCWGHFLADPIKTITTRRADLGSTPIPLDALYHHVLAVWLPTDGGVAWATLGGGGLVSVGTGVNELGTCASIHDYNSYSGWPYSPWLPRTSAARYAQTLLVDDDLATDANDVFAALQAYDVGTGGFINYHAPEGHGAVIACRRTPRPCFYNLRKPQPSYFGGDVLITTNSWTDGTYTPSGGEFMATYYQNLENTAQKATMQTHWSVMGDVGFHQLTVGYRGRGDMAIWFDGQLNPGRTPRVELEWADLDSRKSLTLNVVNETWGTVEVSPNQPIYEPNQALTLTASPIEGKYFRQWLIYDPNYPGDANHAATDTNLAIALIMITDQHVEAAFKCGSGLPLAMLTLGAAVVGLMRGRRSTRTPGIRRPRSMGILPMNHHGRDARAAVARIRAQSIRT